MSMTNRDHSLDALLSLDEERFGVDGSETCWVKFEVKECDVTPERPHGLKYSLTLHAEDGTRLLGFDNAHGITEGSGPGARTRIENTTTSTRAKSPIYDYEDAGMLMDDFWAEVETILQERSN